MGPRPIGAPGRHHRRRLIGAGSVLGIILIALGSSMLVTAVVGTCPLYALLGVDTHRRGRTALGN